MDIPVAQATVCQFAGWHSGEEVRTRASKSASFSLRGKAFQGLRSEWISVEHLCTETFVCISNYFSLGQIPRNEVSVPKHRASVKNVLAIVTEVP